MLPVGAVDEVDEPEAARLARLAVDGDVDARDLAKGREEVLLLEIGFWFVFFFGKKKEEEEGREGRGEFCFVA